MPGNGIPTQEDLGALQALSDAHTNLGSAAAASAEKTSLFGSSMDFAGKATKDVNGYLTDTANLTEAAAAKFSILTNFALGARNAFKEFEKIDGINSISKQFNDVIGVLSSSENAIDKLTNFAANTFPNLIIPEAVSKSVSGLTSFLKDQAKHLGTSADNALKLQFGLIQMSASTGNLSRILGAAGSELEFMNGILSEQQNMLSKTAKATQLSSEQVEQYYSQLGKIPGALEAVITNTAGTSEVTNMLTATIQFATGSGMAYADVMAHLGEAFKMYNATGEDALTFTARMSEISNNYGVELKDIESGLTTAAGAFKSYGSAGKDAGQMLEGTARVMNDYIGRLKESGLSGKQATDVIANMTGQIGKLDIAQKAFLSMQTGGPGGLMGGYQIEKMMKEGKIDEVMEKVRTSMTKQFGKIMTLEEAAESPAAAAQLTKQRMMLQQGPLGSLARSPEEASRILEAFAKGPEATKGLQDNVLQSTMQTGAKFQETTATEASRIRAILEETRGAANVPSLGLLQQVAGARVGTTMPREFETQVQIDARQNRSAFMRRGVTEGAESVGQYSIGLEAKRVADRSGQAFRQNIQEYEKFFKDIGTTIGAPISYLKELFTSNDVDNEESRRQMNLTLESKKQYFKNEADNATDQKTKQESLNRYQQVVSAQTASAKLEQARSAQMAAGESPVDMVAYTAAHLRSRMPAGAMVGRSVSAASARSTGLAATGGPPATEGLGTAAAPLVIKNDVEIHGVCIKCHQKMLEGSAQSNSLTPGTKE